MSASVTATEFKATCLDLFDQLAAHKITRLTVTKRGKPVAVLIPPDAPEAEVSAFDALYGKGKGLIDWPADMDVITSPLEGVVIHANEGWLLSQDADES